MNRVEVYDKENVSIHPFMRNRQVRSGIDASPRDIRRAVAAYYGMVETMDGHFGKVMAKLTQTGENLDNWIIVYTSDHGEMLGQHGIWEKKQFYEASVRVPLIIRWPKGFSGGRTVNENVNLCDLFSTLCELTGISTPSGLDSRSLVPFLKDEVYNWNNETISQYGVNKLMIKWDDLKYQYYGPDMPEVLFDLKKDPGEEVNFIEDPSYAYVIENFRKRCAELGYSPDANAGYINAGY